MLLKLRLDLKVKGKLGEAEYAEVEAEINELNTILDNKLDNSLEEAITEDVNIQSYY